MERRMRVLLTLIVLLPAVSLACGDFANRTGSSGHTPGPSLGDLTGIWKGEWTTTVGSADGGTVTFVLDQDDDARLTGCSCWAGSTCWDDGGFSGTLKKVALSASLVTLVGAGPVKGNMDVLADFMSGTFVVLGFGGLNPPTDSCTDGNPHTGDEGTLELTREVRSADVVGLCDALALALDCNDVAL